MCPRSDQGDRAFGAPQKCSLLDRRCLFLQPPRRRHCRQAEKARIRHAGWWRRAASGGMDFLIRHSSINMRRSARDRLSARCNLVQSGRSQRERVALTLTPPRHAHQPGSFVRFLDEEPMVLQRGPCQVRESATGSLGPAAWRVVAEVVPSVAGGAVSRSEPWR